MKIFGKEFFSKEPQMDNEQVSTIGVSNFWTLNGLQYNSDNISIDTYRKISKHYQVAAALATISYSIQQIDWFIDAENETVRKVLTLSMERIWNRLIRSISKSFIYGYSPNIKVFTMEKIDGKNYIVYKKIKDLNPADCTVSTDKWGNFNGFVYCKGSLQEKVVSPDVCFWYTNNMENGNLYGSSMLKSVYKPWWFSEKVHEFSNRYYERFGEPLVIGRAPTAAKVKDSDGRVRTAQELMNDVIGSIRSHSSVQLPSDRHVETKEYNYDLKYLESQMRGFDFENYLQRLDMEIFRGLFIADTVYGGGKGGSYALGSTQMETLYTNLMGIMDNIVDYVNLYLLPQLVEYNFQKSKNVSFTYQPLTIDQKKNIQSMIMELIKGGKLKPDTKQLEDRSGVRLSEQTPPAPVKATVTKKDVKTVAQKEVLDALAIEKDKNMEKELQEILKIKEDLISLYE
jgi:hypothetical protein